MAMASKIYDRAQVLQVAAQLLAASGICWADEDDLKTDIPSLVEYARELVDEVERQCPLPGKPEPTIAPIKRGRCGLRWHSDDCDCNGDSGDR